jgi:hypothetical protein
MRLQIWDPKLMLTNRAEPPEPTHFVLTARDYGRDIAPEILTQIFTPFSPPVAARRHRLWGWLQNGATARLQHIPTHITLSFKTAVVGDFGLIGVRLREMALTYFKCRSN